MAIKLINLPLTNENLKPELEIVDGNEEPRVVYRPSRRNQDFYEYYSFWNPGRDYPDGYVAVNFTSAFDGTEPFPAGTKFANATGTKYDPIPGYTSWRQMMRAKIKDFNTCCAETDIIYNSKSGAIVSDFSCTNGGCERPHRDYTQGIWMHGAHVLMNETSSGAPQDNGAVYLLPLCANHNTYDGITGEFGTGYYMKLRRNQEVIKLKNFMHSSIIKNAVSKERFEMKELAKLDSINETNEMEKLQLSVGLEFTFMGADLHAYYIKKPTGYQIFVAPTNVDNNAEISLGEMVAQFNQMAGGSVLSEDDVKKKIETEQNFDGLTAIDWESIKFCLKMLFLNIDSEGEAKTTEYALSLQINAEGLIPKEITIFNVKALSFNIWNTNRQNVLDKMALTTPESF